LDKQRAGVVVQPGEEAHEFFAEADWIGEYFMALGGGAKPFPLTPDAGAALDAGRGIVIKIAQAREREKAKEQHIAQQHEEEKSRELQRALGPLKDAGGK